jgi:hypothetical protein
MSYYRYSWIDVRWYVLEYDSTFVSHATDHLNASSRKLCSSAKVFSIVKTTEQSLIVIIPYVCSKKERNQNDKKRVLSILSR